MQPRATEPRTTPAGSTSSTSSSPDTSSPKPKVTAPPLTVQPIPSPTTENPAAGSPDGASATDPDPFDRTDTPSGSDPAGGDGKPLKVGRRELRDVFRGLVLGASAAVHNTLARTELEQQHGVWLMDDEEEAGGVADPLASIAGRHAGGQVVNNDTADLIAAGVAVAGYVVRNVLRALQLRRAVRNAPPGFIPNPDEEPNQGGPQ